MRCPSAIVTGISGMQPRARENAPVFSPSHTGGGFLRTVYNDINLNDYGRSWAASLVRDIAIRIRRGERERERWIIRYTRQICRCPLREKVAGMRRRRESRFLSSSERRARSAAGDRVVGNPRKRLHEFHIHRAARFYSVICTATAARRQTAERRPRLLVASRDWRG